MQELLGVPERTLRDWKKKNRSELYKLLEAIDYNTAKKLLAQNNNNDLKKLLENEQYYPSERDFEKDLYAVLTSGRNSDVWLKLSKDTALSKVARARSAYLYSFLTRKPTVLSFKTPKSVGFYHGNRNQTGNGLAKLYGLENGIDMRRFNQYKMTGRF
ncbi:MAG: hypothetical protein U9R13_08900 [Campylobacterota bacterium]|nr:hypothetical protein [Campylobacterota bacterium]